MSKNWNYVVCKDAKYANQSLTLSVNCDLCLSGIYNWTRAFEYILFNSSSNHTR